jgi:putative ABC transport system ATP-binding protein
VTQSSLAIYAHNLTLTLGNGDAAVSILKGIDLAVPQGQSLALLGPSGSGKSSLMAVLVAGENFAAMDEDALARARRGRIGIVLQAFHLLPTMTALENVATPLELAGMPGAAQRAAEELGYVGLGHRLTHYPAQLSGGEQQRVAIARALAPRPALLFADEPTGNLDGATGHEIIDLLFARQAEAEATLIIVTHDRELAARCQRVITLGDGRIASDSSAA